MAEYLEREGLLRELRLWNLHKAEPDNFHYTELKAWLEALPAEDVQPVKHGRWILNSDRIPVCSVCEEIALQKILLRFPTPEYYSKFVLSDYCPYCGAKMDGAE